MLCIVGRFFLAGTLLESAVDIPLRACYRRWRFRGSSLAAKPCKPSPKPWFMLSSCSCSCPRWTAFDGRYTAPRGDTRLGRERHRGVTDPRRCREDDPAHRPVRPCKKTPCSRPTRTPTATEHAWNAQDSSEPTSSRTRDQARRSLSPTFCSRPLPTAVPRSRTLCMLLI